MSKSTQPRPSRARRASGLPVLGTRRGMKAHTGVASTGRMKLESPTMRQCLRDEQRRPQQSRYAERRGGEGTDAACCCQSRRRGRGVDCDVGGEIVLDEGGRGRTSGLERQYRCPRERSNGARRSQRRSPEQRDEDQRHRRLRR